MRTGAWTCVVIVLVGLGLAPAGCAAAGKGLRIYWVDVEGGAATLIVTPAGESILVDTGMPGDRDPVRIAKVAKDVAGLKAIDHLIVTHFDVDHLGGAADLAKLMPIRRVYDPGDEGAVPQRSHDAYVAFRKTVPYTVLAPGDTVPLRAAEGSPPVRLVCLAAARKFIEPGPGHKANPIPASESPEYPDDPSDNARSTVLLLTFGNFEFLDGADLTGGLELRLVSPVNLVGEVDLYQVNHHGLDRSNNPVLIRSIRPTVTVMNNGHRKGCGPKTREALKAVDSIQANYQLHKNLAPGADNTPDAFIANFEPAETCKANHIEAHVAPDGSAYVVRIPATGHERVFKTK